LDEFCQRFPLNSRCEGETPQNSESVDSLEAPLQVVNVHLNVTGSEDEMVVLEIDEETVGDITLSAYHIERTEDDGFFTFSNLLNGAIGAVSPVPIPFDLFQSFTSQASQTEYIAFTPDDCMEQMPLVNGQGFQLADCSIVGTDTLSLSEDVDIRSGFFTLGYIEGALLRAIIFRIGEHDAEFVGALELGNLCQRFPLNSRCRYWPISQTEPLTVATKR
ncbi:MAG: hypothetical protein AAFN08_07875, partial [Cyanobacteria bacterium J06559_3]